MAEFLLTNLQDVSWDEVTWKADKAADTEDL
jgi:hypothetical protein